MSAAVSPEREASKALRNHLSHTASSGRRGPSHAPATSEAAPCFKAVASAAEDSSKQRARGPAREGSQPRNLAMAHCTAFSPPARPPLSAREWGSGPTEFWPELGPRPDPPFGSEIGGLGWAFGRLGRGTGLSCESRVQIVQAESATDAASSGPPPLALRISGALQMLVMALGKPWSLADGLNQSKC